MDLIANGGCKIVVLIHSLAMRRWMGGNLEFLAHNSMTTRFGSGWEIDWIWGMTWLLVAGESRCPRVNRNETMVVN